MKQDDMVSAAYAQGRRDQSERDTALLRQALESLRGYRREMGCEQPCDAEVALRERLERKNENAN